MSINYSPVLTESPSKLEDINPKERQIIFKKFHNICDGKNMAAKQDGVFYLSNALIILTCTLFFIFDCPFLASELSIAIPVVAAILLMFVMANLFKTSFTDPGYIPRAFEQEDLDIKRNFASQTQAMSPAMIKIDVPVNGQMVNLKYCYTCKILRPPRASHCSLCDNCVDKFDHHCPWVGNCVGRRNYRYFYIFLISLSLLSILVLSFSIYHMVVQIKEYQFFEAMRRSPGSPIVIVITFFAMWSVVGLAGFHTYLILSNQTTNEDIKGSFSAKTNQVSSNPYKGSVCWNLFDTLCRPMPPSFVDSKLIKRFKMERTNEPPKPYTSIPLTETETTPGEMQNPLEPQEVQSVKII